MSVRFDFSGVALELVGLEPQLASRLISDWAPFCAAESTAPFLRLEVRRGDTRTIRSFAPKLMRSRIDAGSAWFEMPQGQAEVELTGEGRILLHADDMDQAYYTVQNMIRACLAWSLPGRSGALVHSAGLVLDGKAFLLVGPERSGKSTWTALGAAAGATVLSDDLVLIDGADKRTEALGSPFRSTHRGALRPGRWPVAAVLFPHHGRVAGVAPASGILARARVLANLPFVAEAVGSDDRIDRLLSSLTRSVRCLDFTFAPDPSFVPLLRRLAGE